MRLSADVEAALIDAGYRPGRIVGAGMEGVGVDLGDELVVKTWHARGREELDRLRSFYSAVERSGLTLAAPRIVSAALQTATPTKAMSSLPVLAGERAFDGAGEFGGELADLVRRRVRRFHVTLDGTVADLDRVVAATVSRLREGDPVRSVLVHGDLIPANILVDESGVPSAILDFGFFSTLSDPRFDAAVAAGIHDMYGARARTNEAIIDDAVVAEFGYDHQRLLVTALPTRSPPATASVSLGATATSPGAQRCSTEPTFVKRWTSDSTAPHPCVTPNRELLPELPRASSGAAPPSTSPT